MMPSHCAWRLNKKVWIALAARPRLVIGLLLTVLIAAVYAQTGQFQFVSLDDKVYVSENKRVAGGISTEGLLWAFSFEEKDQTYWHPLTWLAHMLDVELFGLKPGGHHLINVLLHLLNCFLLFVFLQRTTGAVWLSGICAALFAVHPLNVESVAWVAEKKSVLSTVFWMLSLICYVHYVRHPRRPIYAALLVVFTLGLLSKPMIVTLPFALLLIDFWPLGRLNLLANALRPTTTASGILPAFAAHSPWDPIKEKIPLFLLSALTVYLASSSVRFSLNTVSFDTIPLEFRLANMAVSYVTYISKIILPTDLAVYYPYPKEIAVGRVLAAVAMLCAFSAVALSNLKRRPYILMGWLWFLGTAVPVSGIVQVGVWPEWADRWAYLPQLGLIIIGVWGVKDLIAAIRPKAAIWAIFMAASVVAVLGLSAHRQTQVWANDVTLYRHALERVPNNFLAHSNLGSLLLTSGRTLEAIDHLHEAARISPEYSFPIYTLALQLLYQQSPQSAAPCLLRAVSLDSRLQADGREPSHTSGAACWGASFLDRRVAWKTRIPDKISLNCIGALYMLMGRSEEAIEAFQEAIGIDPAFVDAHNNIGIAYLKVSRYAEASVHFKRALDIEPGNPAARRNIEEFSVAAREN